MLACTHARGLLHTALRSPEGFSGRLPRKPGRKTKTELATRRDDAGQVTAPTQRFELHGRLHPQPRGLRNTVAPRPLVLPRGRRALFLELYDSTSQGAGGFQNG